MRENFVLRRGFCSQHPASVWDVRYRKLCAYAHGRALCFHRVIHHPCEKETRETTHWRRQNFLHKISKKSFYHIHFIYLEKYSAVSISYIEIFHSPLKRFIKIYSISWNEIYHTLYEEISLNRVLEIIVFFSILTSWEQVQLQLVASWLWNSYDAHEQGYKRDEGPWTPRGVQSSFSTVIGVRASLCNWYRRVLVEVSSRTISGRWRASLWRRFSVEISHCRYIRVYLRAASKSLQSIMDHHRSFSRLSLLRLIPVRALTISY